MTDAQIGALKRQASEDGSLDWEDVCRLVDEVRRLRDERDAIVDLAIAETWERIADGKWNKSNPKVVRHFWSWEIGHTSGEAASYSDAIAAIRAVAKLDRMAVAAEGGE